MKSQGGVWGCVLVNMNAFGKTSRNAVWRVYWRGKEVGKWVVVFGSLLLGPYRMSITRQCGGSCTRHWQGLLWVLPGAQGTNCGQPCSCPKAGEAKAAFHFPSSQQISKQPETVTGCLTSFPQKMECYHSQCLLPDPLFFQKLGRWLRALERGQVSASLTSPCLDRHDWPFYLHRNTSDSLF